MNPMSNSTKNSKRQWLQKQNIPLTDVMLKPEIYHLIK
jgi:hypothetical protein